MSNSYIEFSVALPVHSDEERKFLQQQIAEVPLNPNDPKSDLVIAYLKDIDGLDGYEKQELPAIMEFIQHDDKPALWMYSDEHGNAHLVSLLIQQFLQKFRHDDHFKLTFAWTCSKPAIDQFGGGIIIVNAKEIYSVDPVDIYKAWQRGVRIQ